jgi:hypothetical protein
VTIAALARKDAGDEVRALEAPKIGGVVRSGGARKRRSLRGVVLGVLVQLGHKLVVVAPQGVTGSSSGPASRERRRPVGYGEVLLSVVRSPLTSRRGRRRRTHPPRARTGSRHRDRRASSIPAASPGGPPFAPKGAQLHAGQTIGLIEVMKTFNPIAYGGGALHRDGGGRGGPREGRRGGPGGSDAPRGSDRADARPQALLRRSVVARATRTRVVAAGRDLRGAFVRLDETIFYPEGGGQPADAGASARRSSSTSRLRPKASLHYVDREIRRRRGRDRAADFVRRFDHSQQHNGPAPAHRGAARPSRARDDLVPTSVPRRPRSR